MQNSRSWHQSGEAFAGHSVSTLQHDPLGPAKGSLVWAHGGSWQHGSASRWGHVTARLAAATGWRVASVDYRLAPRHRFPRAVQDVLAAVAHADRTAPDLPLVVGGDSAGGTIASVAALTRRDRGERVPGQLLAYPPLDPACSRASYHARPEAFPSRRDLRAAWRLWLGALDERTTTGIHVSPLDATGLAGMAPVHLAVGSLDPVLDDAVEYARRLSSHRVQVTLDVLPGVGHADILQSPSPVLESLVAALSTYDHHGRTPPCPNRQPSPH